MGTFRWPTDLLWSLALESYMPSPLVTTVRSCSVCPQLIRALGICQEFFPSESPAWVLRFSGTAVDCLRVNGKTHNTGMFMLGTWGSVDWMAGVKSGFPIQFLVERKHTNFCYLVCSLWVHGRWLSSTHESSEVGWFLSCVPESFVFSEGMLNVVLFAFSYFVSIERLHSLWNTEATLHHSDKLYVVLLFIFLNTAVSSILLFCDRYLCVGLWGKLFHSF